jgi:hypothetical protein
MPEIMKAGRNDPCPCGSGRKYKHCCLLKETASVTDLHEQTWRRVRAAIDGYAASMLRFVTEAYGPGAIHQAWLEFTIGRRDKLIDSDRFAPGDPHTELFFSWLFHKWSPKASKGNRISDAAFDGVPPTRAYLIRRGGRLDPLLRSYLEACLTAPFAFYEIQGCKPGAGFTARDVFAGTELKVREHSASATLKDGDIVFGQIVEVSGIALVEAVSPYGFPPIYKTHLIHVRQRQELRSHRDLALRGLYFSLAESYLHPPQPKLHNTDGEPLEPRTLYFDIDSAQSAFDALVPLALGNTREELLLDAKLDAAGAVAEADIPWIRRNEFKRASLESVVLGHLHIEGRKLTVEVNSAARARAFKALIAKIPVSARYRRTRRQPLDIGKPPATSGSEAAARDAEQAELMQRPEVWAHLEQLQRRHYENWADVPLPALNNKTPLEAVQNADGREMVDALITQFERDSARMPVPPGAEVFIALRRRLGL